MYLKYFLKKRSLPYFRRSNSKDSSIKRSVGKLCNFNKMNYRIKEIWIYPVKGMRGVSVSSAMAYEEGFQNDRRYMLVDKNGLFYSQRNHPTMAKFDSKIANNRLSFSYEDKFFEVEESDTFPLDKVTVWDNHFLARQVSLEADHWLSEILGAPTRLMKLDKKSNRIKSIPSLDKETKVSFADGYPYLVLGTSSMDLLNEKLESEVGHDRFRANMLLETMTPHEEDTWSHFQANEAQFQIVKPCVRCQVINIDQKSGERYKEPTKTLASYRAFGHKIQFGANVICTKVGKVSVGDIVSLQ